MPQPYNYNIQPANPLQDILGGIQTGMQLDSMKMARENTIKKQNDMSSLLDNPSLENYRNIVTQYPDLAEPYKLMMEQISTEKKSNIVRDASQMYHALDAGNSGIVKEMLEQRKVASKGKPEDEAFYDNALKMLEINPNAVKSSLAGIIYAGDPKTFEKSLTGLEESKADIAKTGAEAKKIGLEASVVEREAAVKELLADNAKRAQDLAETKYTKENMPGFDEDTRKDYALTRASLERNNDEARQLEDLQNKLEGVKFGGAYDTYARKFDQFWTGADKDKRDVILMNAKQLAMSTAFQLKQAGAMSDNEYEEYMTTVPNGNSSSKVVGDWVRGVYDKNKQAYGALNIKRAFYDKTKSMGPASEKFTLEVNGKKIIVNKGETIENVNRKIGKDLSRFAPSSSDPINELSESLKPKPMTSEEADSVLDF